LSERGIAAYAPNKPPDCSYGGSQAVGENSSDAHELRNAALTLYLVEPICSRNPGRAGSKMSKSKPINETRSQAIMISSRHLDVSRIITGNGNLTQLVQLTTIISCVDSSGSTG